MSEHADASGFRIRLYQPDDFDALYDICLKTGDSGEDASHKYTDPALLGHVYVGPYITFEPELAFVLEDDAGACGYCIGALDTRVFNARCETKWYPPLRETYPEPTAPKSTWQSDDYIKHLLYHPQVLPESVLRAYPSHLHIDLLPRAQGKRQGQRLMRSLFTALADRGSHGVHLGLGMRNTRALRFYQKLGFTLLNDAGLPQQAYWMGRALP